MFIRADSLLSLIPGLSSSLLATPLEIFQASWLSSRLIFLIYLVIMRDSGAANTHPLSLSSLEVEQFSEPLRSLSRMPSFFIIFEINIVISWRAHSKRLIRQFNLEGNTNLMEYLQRTIVINITSHDIHPPTDRLQPRYPPPLLSVVSAMPSTQKDLDVELQIKAEVWKRQIRIKYFFEDFDKLRKGHCTEDKVTDSNNAVSIWSLHRPLLPQYQSNRGRF